MNSLRLNCLTFSSLPPAIIGILVVAVVAPVMNVALYLPGVKSTPAVIKHVAYHVIIKLLTTLHLHIEINFIRTCSRKCR